MLMFNLPVGDAQIYLDGLFPASASTSVVEIGGVNEGSRIRSPIWVAWAPCSPERSLIAVTVIDSVLVSLFGPAMSGVALIVDGDHDRRRTVKVQGRMEGCFA